MAAALYSIGTWDADLQAFTPQTNVPAFNLTLWQLKQSMWMLRDHGYSVHRYQDEYGGHYDNDINVLIERTDGMDDSAILAAAGS